MYASLMQIFLHHSHHSPEPQALRFPLRTQAPAAKTSAEIHRKIALSTSLQKIFYSYFHSRYDLCKSALTFSAICSACSSDTFLIQQWGGLLVHVLKIREFPWQESSSHSCFGFCIEFCQAKYHSCSIFPCSTKNDAKTLHLPISSCTLQYPSSLSKHLQWHWINVPSSPLTWVPRRSTHHRWQAQGGSIQCLVATRSVVGHGCRSRLLLPIGFNTKKKAKHLKNVKKAGQVSYALRISLGQPSWPKSPTIH